MGFKERVRRIGERAERDCQSGKKPLGLQLIFHQTNYNLRSALQIALL